MKSVYNHKHDNNLNLLRFFFSISVLLFHVYDLSKEEQLRFLSRFLNPDLAVQGFFIISGYLVSKSFARSSSIKAFYIKRFKRIYPAYIAVILLSVGLGAFISKVNFIQYLTSPLLYKYLFANAVFLNFLQQSLPGVFSDHYFTAVNGSLWTLKIEVAFYLIIPLIFFLRKKIDTHLLYGIIFILSFSFYLAMSYLHDATQNEMYLVLSRQLPGQLFFFISGMWLNEFESYSLFKRIIKFAGIPCFILLFLHAPVPIEVLALNGTVFFIGFTVPAFNYPLKDEDISYGLYIYHFPVIQTLIHFGIFAASPYLGLLISLSCTIIFAVLSWLVIEKPFIKNKNARVKVVIAPVTS